MEKRQLAPVWLEQREFLLVQLGLSESWFQLTWQSCRSRRRRCYKCSVAMLNMAGRDSGLSLDSSPVWPGKERVKEKIRKKTALCLSAACLTSTFISRFQLNRQNCSVSYSFPCSAGLVPMPSTGNVPAGEGCQCGGGGKRRVLDTEWVENSWF